MKRIIWLISLVTCVASGQPKVNPDNTITFNVFAPGADSVKIEGDIIMELTGQYNFAADNSVRLERKTKDSWSVTLGPFIPGPYLYTININGRSMPDPANFQIFNGQKYRKSIVHVGTENGSGLWESRNIGHGTVHRHTYYSPIMKGTTEMYVYTPPGYESGTEKYPVLYLLHGRGEKADSWISAGFADKMADNLINAGKAMPAIIVMPFGWVIPPDAPSGEIPDLLMTNMEKELLQFVIPIIEKSYRIKANASFRAIAGFSMGGAQAAHIGLRNPGKFANVGIFSAGIPEFIEEHNNVLDNPGKTNNDFKLLLFCTGDKDNIGPGGSSVKGQRLIDSLLSAKGIKHLYHEMPDAGHTWKAWRFYLGEILLPKLWIN